MKKNKITKDEKILNKGKLSAKKSGKAFKYGGYSATITIILIVAIIALNVIASVAENNGGWKLDLTKNKIYTLDELTIQSLQDLKKDIVIYSFQPAGSEEPLIVNLLDLYAAKTEHITIKQIDPVKNPSQMSQFNTDTKTVGEYSVVVTQADDVNEHFYVINLDEMTETDSDTSKNYFILQQRLTSAILYMNTDILPNVYFLTGHGEEVTTTAAATLFNRIELENYNVTTLDLKMSTTSIQKGDVLVVMNPTSDLTAEERELIIDFLEEHGKAVFFFNPDTSGNLSNFKAVLGYYQITVNSDIIMENDATRRDADNAFLIRPALTLHDITSPIRENGTSVYIKEACSISYAGKQDDYYSFDKLLSTSTQSISIPIAEYLNEQYKDKTYTQASSTVAAAYTKVDVNTAVEDNETRIVVIGSSDVAVGDDANNLGDMNLVRNSVNWVAGKQDQLFIAGVDITTDYLGISSYNTIVWLLIILIIAIPLVLIACGVTVWIRRKNL